MDFDYSKVKSLPEDEFERNRLRIEDVASDDSFRRCSEPEMREVETYLDVQTGVLEGLEFYIQKGACTNCGRELDFEDFVRTSVTDGGHSKSAVLHTLLGNKRVLNKPRQIRCSACGTMTVAANFYASPLYACKAEGQVA